MERTSQQVRPHKLYLLDSAHINDVKTDLDIGKQPQKSKERRWCCALCGTYVTDENQRIYINATLEHHKTNPQGYTFEFCSFKHAPGCVRLGELTSEHSWFAGYVWQFAHCGMCKVQLGWYFAGPEPFFGLIKRQIVQCPEDESL